MAQYDAKGRQVSDPTPVAMPSGYKKPESLVDLMKRLIRSEVSTAAETAGAESFEEANDFEIADEDPELLNTRYEEMTDEEPRQPDRARNADARGSGTEGRAGESQGSSRRPVDDGDEPGERHRDGSRTRSAERSGGGSDRRYRRGEDDEESEDRPSGRNQQTGRSRQTSGPSEPTKGHYRRELDGGDPE